MHSIADLLSPESWAALKRLGHVWKRDAPPPQKKPADPGPELTEEEEELAWELAQKPTGGYARFIGGGAPPS